MILVKNLDGTFTIGGLSAEEVAAVSLFEADNPKHLQQGLEAWFKNQVAQANLRHLGKLSKLPADRYRVVVDELAAAK